MAHPNKPANGMQLARSAPATARRPTTPAAVARPAVEVTAGRLTVVQEADTSVLVHRVETALVVRTREWPAFGPPTMSTRGSKGQQR